MDCRGAGVAAGLSVAWTALLDRLANEKRDRFRTEGLSDRARVNNNEQRVPASRASAKAAGW